MHDQNVDVYAEGSWCIAWLPTKLFGSHAFVTHWKGPFLIERRLSTKAYRLREPTTGKVFQVNADNLRHFKRRADIMQRYPRMDSPIQSDHWAESASVADLSEPDLRRSLERSAPEVPLDPPVPLEPELFTDGLKNEHKIEHELGELAALKLDGSSPALADHTVLAELPVDSVKPEQKLDLISGASITTR